MKRYGMILVVILLSIIDIFAQDLSVTKRQFYAMESNEQYNYIGSFVEALENRGPGPYVYRDDLSKNDVTALKNIVDRLSKNYEHLKTLPLNGSEYGIQGEINAVIRMYTKELTNANTVLTKWQRKTQNTGSLKFDGVYYYENNGSTLYFKFYKSGKVLFYSSKNAYNDDMFYQMNDEWGTQGEYDVDNTKINFKINSDNYTGTILQDGLILNDIRYVFK